LFTFSSGARSSSPAVSRAKLNAAGLGLSLVPPPLLSVKDVAQRLGVTPATVYKLRDIGALPSVRVGANVIRVAEDALVAFIAVPATRP
jgi:excisionase family DNA binding protein